VPSHTDSYSPHFEVRLKETVVVIVEVTFGLVETSLRSKITAFWKSASTVIVLVLTINELV